MNDPIQRIGLFRTPMGARILWRSPRGMRQWTTPLAPNLKIDLDLPCLLALQSALRMMASDPAIVRMLVSSAGTQAIQWEPDA